MSDLISPDGPRRLLTDLCRLVADRTSVEEEIRSGFAARQEAIAAEHQKALRLLEEGFRAEKEAVEGEHASKRSETTARFESERVSLEKEYEATRAGILARYNAAQDAAQQTLQDAHWEAMEACDASRGGMNLPLKEVVAGLESRWQGLQTLHKEALALVGRRGHLDELPEAAPVALLLEKHPGRRFCHALEQAQAQWRTLADQRLPDMIDGLRPFGFLLAFWFVAAVPALIVFRDLSDWRWAATSGGAAALVWAIAYAVVYHIAKRKTLDAYVALRNTLLEAGVGHADVLEAAKSECQRLDASVIARHKGMNMRADELYAAAVGQNEHRKEAELEKADATYPQRLADLDTWRQNALKELDAKFSPLLQQIADSVDTESARIRTRYDNSLAENQQRFERESADLLVQWQTGLDAFHASLEGLQKTCRDAFPDWNAEDWRRWTAPTVIPPVIRFGTSRIELAAMKGAAPDDERLCQAMPEYALPAVLPFPRHSLLLLKAAGPGRARAVDLMQSVMLRMLTAMPPGKVRFTIIDPVGLGDNFSAFMHLADYDEQLVSSRIWTDSNHIEQQLADLTKHMENVIQVYLRKEFQSIEEYNAFAGEMAEPYRVLVVANFPSNVSDSAAQRIKSIVASGARCGVFVLLSIDAKLQLPRSFILSDFEADGLSLRWDEDRFIWDHPDYGPVAVECDPPPAPERFTEILHAVGTAAKDSGHVEVPFSCIIPEAKDWWTFDSRAGIDVPLGRAGAMKLQHLDLGAGTSQHVLISGKTGSGKSTLLHVLITNMALRYSPDEVELYLIDFKKGVEFKAYARAELPHARVVAIESEREFGLSVLQRLDAELRTRGDLFRNRGMQDLKTYRAAEPQARLPRILLMIDEFQELFVEDDRIAQESALLLDRLVRQGRAFGIHIMLGSQTLGGAYTLARSTIGQMAVRIALQCSEADAHLILSEDNTAARLLTRPGEAIYNDANGLYEGNHPFQIVWLSDVDRDAYLEHVRELTRERHCRVPPTIVFEGNVLADPSDNPNLRALLASPTWPEPGPAVHAWLGSAVAIKEPTSAVFVRQNGSNLLLVGHREEAALGVMASCFVSLAAQLPPRAPGGQGAAADGPRFYILDGIRPDAPEVGFWKRLAPVAPQSVEVAGVRDTADVIGRIAAEVGLRQQENRDTDVPIYLFLYNLGRFRDLKKEDDYGFSSSDDKPSSPAKQLAAILRDGPPLGIHTVLWCDTFSNVNRMLDRQALRDFEMRVLFQMNPNDSSSLMDSPEAAKLGVHRAFLYDEGQGRMEKFRPYGLPSGEWLAWVKGQLARPAS